MEDPFAEADEVKEEYGLNLVRNDGKDYDAVVIAIPHEPYLSLTDLDFCKYDEIVSNGCRSERNLQGKNNQSRVLEFVIIWT